MVSFLFAVTFGCFYKNNGSFYLRCSENRHIDVHNATLGRSGHNTCWRECCQSSQDCTVDASTLQVQHLKDTCDGRQECHIQVQQQRCGLYETDYETVTYRCKTLGELPVQRATRKLPVQHSTGKLPVRPMELVRGSIFEKFIKLVVRTNVMSVKVVPTMTCHLVRLVLSQLVFLFQYQ